MIDVHSHVLPGIDDGSRSIEMSINMLKMSQSQGVDTMIATPHFYISRTDADKFKRKRETSYNKLMEAISDNYNLPKIHLGAEVYYFNGISRYDGLDKLVFEGTNNILLEMPFNKWSDKIIREVSDLKDNNGLNIIIAHIERFIDYQKGTDYIEQLLSIGVIVQMNSEYVLGFFSKRRALNMIKQGMVKIIGSDCHNTEKRPPNLGKAFDVIKNKLGDNYVDKINKEGYNLIGDYRSDN